MAEEDEELVVVVPSAHQAGVWANDAVVHAGDHEMTLDFFRVDHSVDPNVGTVVARVAISPKLLGQLIDELTEVWDDYAASVARELIEGPLPEPPDGG